MPIPILGGDNTSSYSARVDDRGGGGESSAFPLVIRALRTTLSLHVQLVKKS